MIKLYKPTSPGRRNQSTLANKYERPSKSIKKHLMRKLLGSKGRSKGRITMHHKHSGAKKKYRIIDFKRNKYNIPAKVRTIDYDPFRSSDIALLVYSDGEKRYILATENMKVGDEVISGNKTEIKEGNCLKLKNIPIGMSIHNIELYPSAGGKFVRGAGTEAIITAKEDNYVNIKMPSGEVRRFLNECYATIGKVSNFEWNLINWGKAGRKYHRGIRPTTRGIAKTVNDHRLGGKYSRRLGKHPTDKWGNLSKGKKTRKRKHTNKYIVRQRKNK